MDDELNLKQYFFHRRPADINFGHYFISHWEKIINSSLLEDD